MDNAIRHCQQCRRPLGGRAGYAFRPANRHASGVIKCLRCALRHWPMLRRSLVAGAVVGTALTALNQGDAILLGQFSGALAWKIPLTYCVPFLVATYGALSNSRN